MLGMLNLRSDETGVCGRLIWIVCLEAEDEVAALVHFHDVATNGRGRRVFGLSTIRTRVDTGALHLSISFSLGLPMCKSELRSISLEV